MQTNYTRPHPKPETPGPRNPPQPDLGPAEVLTILDRLSRRQAARDARLSSLTRLRGGR